MNRWNLQRASRLLTYILRHHPETVGLQLDANGYLLVEDLLVALAQQRDTALTRADLEEIVRTNDKQRFAYDPTGQYIRAQQGHSLAVELQLVEQLPPEVLYHGSPIQNMVPIVREGLQKQTRQQVHLTADYATARKRADRDGRGAVLEIQAQQMARDGYLFYCTDNQVWLTEFVPKQYIIHPE